MTVFSVDSNVSSTIALPIAPFSVRTIQSDRVYRMKLTYENYHVIKMIKPKPRSLMNRLS